MSALISIHALREESDVWHTLTVKEYKEISIHALREESDVWHTLTVKEYKEISIHALREESDVDYINVGLAVDISIHALREESDRLPPAATQSYIPFQSTLSARRATPGSGKSLHAVFISIHALREESDHYA